MTVRKRLCHVGPYEGCDADVTLLQLEVGYLNVGMRH